MSIAKLYFLINVLPVIQAITILSGTLLLTLGLLLFYVSSDADSEFECSPVVSALHLILGVVIFLAGLLIPTTNDIAKIYALHYITTNKNVTKLPENINKLINKVSED